jgi:hypothetical protein
MLVGTERLEGLIAEVKNRTHNLPEEMQREAMSDAISEDFDRAVEKCADYRMGDSILKNGGYFNTLGLGNWLSIAASAGIEAVPARLLSATSTIDLFAICMGHKGGVEKRLSAFDADLSKIKDSEILRFDACAYSGLKASLSEGRPKIGDDQKGWKRRDSGEVDYAVCDRLVDSFLNNPEPHMVAWARPIVDPLLRQGWSSTSGAPGEWPKEWRVYVEAGEVVGVSNYYLQSSATDGEIPQAEKAISLTQQIIDALKQSSAYPHHPRYEGARNTETQSFSADWMEINGGGMFLVEAGPAHLRSPNWGAHPCCFDHRKGVYGMALALGDNRPLPTPANGG